MRGIRCGPGHGSHFLQVFAVTLFGIGRTIGEQRGLIGKVDRAALHGSRFVPRAFGMEREQTRFHFRILRGLGQNGSLVREEGLIQTKWAPGLCGEAGFRQAGLLGRIGARLCGRGGIRAYRSGDRSRSTISGGLARAPLVLRCAGHCAGADADNRLVRHRPGVASRLSAPPWEMIQAFPSPRTCHHD